ncbi:MAG: metallophosphoesterase [Bacteroidales bacterium]|jgi:serine/threonine protein phosphatase 1|nr:metallophosphoesterase [Bacteroidales bacterium]MDD2687110.1 metallophosphoesterase [Bacteroidales bacterium]MDD3330538.1 metallophosphoesterase [Bacteroidales bacterium]MDD3691808.1 metallophosphoesterase [Bacteroidales bacterium]MDD4044754.1 metallophosphoesterase [Bacteroidales bacterium]
MPNQWVIPDVHGCYYTLKSLVENHIRLTRDDELYLLGDLIDRGKYSKQVLDYLMDLEKQGYSIKPVRGNHEAYFLSAYQSELTHKKTFFGKSHSKEFMFWYRVGGKESLESFQVDNIQDISPSYVKWIEKMPYYYILNRFIIVHAGLNFTIENPLQDKYYMLNATHFQVIPEKIGHKIIIHGHIPLSMDGIDTLLKEKEMYHYICIDNGCYYEQEDAYGSLLALNLQNMELLSQVNIDH